MEDDPPRAVHSTAVLLALVIGVGTVVAVAGTRSLLTGASLNLSDEFPIFLMQGVFVAVPFLLLAFLGVRARTSWIVGVMLTAAFWGFLLYDAVSHYGQGRGANIGLGLLMMVSPIIVSAACLGAGWRYLPKGEQD